MSCIFQEDGSFKIYANGVQIVDNTSTGDANLPLNPIIPWYAGAPQSNNWASHINLGRTNGAGWASENGYIGDVFVYTSALSDTDRMQLEADLTTKFITNATLGYTITASAGPNGSIDPSGATPVIQGENLTYTITQGTGAVVADVLVDGVSVGPVNSYTFASVSADHTIDATFLALPNQTIEASSGANGSISPSGVLSVVADSSQTFTITPDPDFKVDAVLVDGVSVGPVTSYTFAHVVTAHTIAASFKSVFLNGFAYARMLPMTFGSYVGAETLVNFPALVRLSEAIPGFLYGDVLSNGADLRFTAADGTELSYEIDTWNPDGESLIWVQVPAFMNGTTIKMFYGKSGDTPPAYALDGSTWSEGYHGVWHMNTAGAADAGPNTLDASGVGQLTAASGQIGTAQAITNPGADYARTPGFMVGQKITVSTWVQGVNGMSGFPRIVTNNYGNSYSLGGDGSTPRQWLFIVNGNFYAAPTPIAEDGTWQYAAATFENGTSRLYINGVYVGGNTGIGLPADNSSAWGFGANSGGGEGFKGSMDEVRISAVSRSADWIKAEYDNQFDPAAFLAFGTIETGGATDTYASWILGYPSLTGPNALPGADPDHDGMNNREEYAFALNPTLGSSVNPITAPINKTTGRFSYTRRATPALTGLVYTVWTSTDLRTWTRDPGAIQAAGAPVGSVETVAVTLTGSKPLLATKLFVRVEAQ